MSIVPAILVVLIAFLAGMEGILDEFQFHQPLIACTLIGLVTGHLVPCIILGGSLQMIALGWANIGAAVAPDAALASVASAIILVLSGNFDQNGISAAIAVAVPLAVAGLFLTMIVRTVAVPIVHIMDRAADEGNYRKIELWHMIAVGLQGVRIAVPAALLLLIPAERVAGLLNSMPAWLNEGMTIGGGMVVAVGYAMVINMMATREVWPFFIIGFVLAAVSQLTLIALGAIAIAIALIYLNLQESGSNNGGQGGSSNTGDPLGDILNDY
ncbi:PTS mannose/fructose/sorbose transporter subunit IIC [Enterococcus timonensis]|uniref:PTS mannose/fructose/sorbose transporter subunit IIC n=1 Tax=Enterococcus timonensis TaxID=1852364 RepID=UPI0008D94170|nr:PTS mannose/fructose/sorbose transporter subunit IIC [Enterococcus timonensis]